MAFNPKNFDFSLADDLLNQAGDTINEMEKIEILVVGKTGVGKSTLINNIFREELAKTGVGKPITQHIQKLSKEDMPINLYDSRGLELSKEVQKQIKEEINALQADLTKEGSHLHAAYYCINANSQRIEEMEIDLIEQLADHMPVIVVLTQSIGEAGDTMKSYIESLNLPIQGVIPVMAADYRINDQVTIEAFGLEDLLNLTFLVIPENVHPAFTNAQRIDIKRKAKAARRWAKKSVAMTFGVGFSPIPFSDATLLVPIQITMLARITAIFGISMQSKQVISILGAVIGTGGATYIGRTIASNLVKFIPGLGSALGGLISGSTAAMVTTALAMSYIEVLTIIAESEAKGEEISLESLNKLMKTHFRKRLRRGKKDKDFQDVEDMKD
ncbi:MULTISPECIES: YcjF family protein [Aerococcus]|uniref:YcjF family protein n=1 Tax=Aerococcus TaxID=1375 RepID=UPI0018A76107|nr:MULTISPECIES: GTPase [Aerococcus]MCY3035734.1 50S ribosome-binding GTPase [Aerococcus sp. Group 2]MCY3039868.1 50S ribosome-binding GTPase [Aerococcus sp. Group 2]MCY3040402.1 50S ribosome-binding GTPase [Aerococcus sp. Group 2]MCY3043326.1 50S ribosome-binding GTPase [Aerococcus sp. Group 2]MDK6519846.1 50S ribosome-binding GTPase [Aerococcus urinae]